MPWSALMQQHEEKSCKWPLYTGLLTAAGWGLGALRDGPVNSVFVELLKGPLITS